MHLNAPGRRSMARATMRGFSLIELMIVITIFAILLLLAIPNFQIWIANSKIRSAAEALQNDLRLAEQTAVAQNHQTALVLTSSQPTAAQVQALSSTPVGPGAPAGYWFVQQTPNTYDVSQLPQMLSISPIGAVSGVQITALQAPAGALNGAGVAAICYSSLGRQVTNTAAAAPIPANCTAVDSRFVVTLPASAGVNGYRILWVTASLSGQVRVCDPSVSINAQPQGC
jgi:type IV fimbrial biogenesis protein FimT